MGSGVSRRFSSDASMAMSNHGTQLWTSSRGGAQEDARRGVQEDARSFGSKLGAIRLLTKNDTSREAFMGFLQHHNKANLLSCYLGLEEIKHIQNEDQAYTRICALVYRCLSRCPSIISALILSPIS